VPVIVIMVPRVIMSRSTSKSRTALNVLPRRAV